MFRSARWSAGRSGRRRSRISIITGVIVDRAGYGTTFLVTATVAAAGAVGWIVVVPRSSR
jgi:hypothetical protein